MISNRMKVIAIFVMASIVNDPVDAALVVSVTAFQVRAHIWYHSSIHLQVFGHNSADMRN
jgi:hypothetical protein